MVISVHLDGWSRLMKWRDTMEKEECDLSDSTVPLFEVWEHQELTHNSQTQDQWTMAEPLYYQELHYVI